MAAAFERIGGGGEPLTVSSRGQPCKNRLRVDAGFRPAIRAELLLS